MKPIILNACILFLIITLATPGAGENTSTGVLTGRITDSKTGSGLPYVSVKIPVTLLTYETLTDADGNFTIDDIPPGNNFTVSVSRDGYKSASFQVSITVKDTTLCNQALLSTYLELLYPDGGETIFAGSEVTIQWTALGIQKIRLEFSINSGRNWIRLADDVNASPGMYIWDVPDIPSEEYRIQILDTGTSGLWDMSDGLFKNSSL